MNILITGATGFIGSHLTKALLKADLNVKVSALVRGLSDITTLQSLGTLIIYMAIYRMGIF